MEINLISDTVTKPSPGMLNAMMAAEVGDDVFRQDPTINRLEKYCADLFGLEDALFCPSGTMTNQIAIKLHTQALDEMICHSLSHVKLYELGGYSFHSGIAIETIDSEDGKLTAGQIGAVIKPETDWYPRSKLVVIENSGNRAGGNYYTIPEIHPIAALCQNHGLKMHLDGARLFNVLAETGEKPEEYGSLFDTISICLSKGLGAPVGSVLIGSKDDMRYARKLRKIMGGGMRQAGYLAAAGLFALENNLERLSIDNQRARETGSLLEDLEFVKKVLPVYTNIVIFELAGNENADAFCTRLKEKGILAAPMGAKLIRFVFHLDITEEMMPELHAILKSLDR